MRAVAVIPARMGSKRFPGKVLSLVDGDPLVVHVWRQVCSVNGLDEVYVATADEAVADVVTEAGGKVLITTDLHRCGTDRVAEAVTSVAADIVVNVQADCGVIRPGLIERLVSALKASDAAAITPVAPVNDVDRVSSTDCVKVVVDATGKAVYFSRAPVPHKGPWLSHIGIYGFRRHTLEAFATLAPSPLEVSEDLEQLRLIENGFTIQTILTDASSISVDSPRDLRRLQAHHSSQIRGTHA